MTTDDTNAEHDLVERNDALKFAQRTRHNLEVIEQHATATWWAVPSFLVLGLGFGVAWVRKGFGHAAP